MSDIQPYFTKVIRPDIRQFSLFYQTKLILSGRKSGPTLLQMRFIFVWLKVSMVKEVTYFVHEEFNQLAYESCKNVQYPEVSRFSRWFPYIACQSPKTHSPIFTFSFRALQFKKAFIVNAPHISGRKN